MQTCEPLLEKSKDLIGKPFTGYIQNKADNGYFIHFFNGIHSHLTTDEVYKLGHTLQVYVTYLSQKGNLGVSL